MGRCLFLCRKGYDCGYEMKIWILALAVTLGVGCAAIKQAKDDAQTCLTDPLCREEAINKAKEAKEVALAIGGASPIPLSSNVIGGAIYGLVLVYSLIKGGRKKKEEVSP